MLRRTMMRRQMIVLSAFEYALTVAIPRGLRYPATAVFATYPQPYDPKYFAAAEAAPRLRATG
jgi:hypothetical protein